MSRFWVEKVTELQPYVPGEQPATGSVVKLNTNEHALSPSDAVMAAISAVQGEQLRRYPDPAASGLRDAIAAVEGLTAACVFPGNGSDEVLAHLWFAFLSGRTVRTLDTTYGFYPVWAKLYGSQLVEVPVLEDFSVDIGALGQSHDAIVLANPNAPTGLALRRADIESLVASNRDRLVIIDEAYYGFGAESAAPLVADYDNLMISRSLSKSHALAGMRVGYALAHPDLIEGLNRVKDSFNSYPLDAVAQAAATAAIIDAEWFEQASQAVAQSRAQLTEGLVSLGFQVLPSMANFVFTRHPEVGGEALFAALRQEGVLVRRWSKPRIEDWLRITVGSGEQNERLLTSVAQFLKNQ
ncbi:MAG: histidinol-phosphate transaminase [Halieaceae bacterium]